MKKYTNLLLIFACLLSCVLIYTNIKRINSGKIQSSSAQKINDSIETGQSSKEDKIKIYFSHENQKIDGNAILQTAPNTATNIKNLFRTGAYKMVFLLTDEQCDLCVDFVVSKLDTLIRNNPQLAEKVLLLAGYDSWIQFDRYIKIKKISFPSYKFIKTEINAPFTKIEKPSLFLLNNELKTRYVFIPDKGEEVGFYNKYIQFAKKMLLELN